jgi:hypothetical protein
MRCLCYRALWFCLWQSWRRLVYRWCLCAIGTLFPEDVNPMSYDITRSQFDRPTIGWPLPVTTIRTMNGVRRRVLILGRKL